VPHLLKVLEHPAVDGVLFKDLDKPFHHTVSLWLRDEGETWGYPLKTVWLETVAGLGYVPANALGVPMFHGAEEPDPAVLSLQSAGAVRAPHDIGGAIMMCPS
jgi:hypothetical protein